MIDELTLPVYARNPPSPPMPRGVVVADQPHSTRMAKQIFKMGKMLGKIAMPTRSPRSLRRRLNTRSDRNKKWYF